MKDTDLKHLTLKTAFWLALASGKCCREIHAWVANKVSNLSQWEKVALFPSSDLIAKNQLAREDSQGMLHLSEVHPRYVCIRCSTFQMDVFISCDYFCHTIISSLMYFYLI